MSDPAFVEAHREAIAVAGQPVIFQRIVLGNPSTTISAAITAVVRAMKPDSAAAAREGFLPSKGTAALQVDRFVIAMKDDLAAAGFPTPVVKGDRIQIVETGDWLQIDDVDNSKRFVAGAVEMTARGVS